MLGYLSFEFLFSLVLFVQDPFPLEVDFQRAFHERLDQLVSFVQKSTFQDPGSGSALGFLIHHPWRFLHGSLLHGRNNRFFFLWVKFSF